MLSIFLLVFFGHLYAFFAEKAMAPHSSTLAWKIPWMEEPGRLQAMGSLRVGHDWAILLSLFTFMHWRRKWQPIPVFLPGESQGRGSLATAIYGVAQSQTRLKWLSIACLLWRNVYLDFLPIFWLCCFLDIELHELFVYFGDWFLLGHFICKYFLPFCWLSFHFIYDFLCCVETFK